MRVLIITDNKPYGSAMKQTLSTITTIDKIIVSDHDNAIGNFFKEEPTHIIICEYEDVSESSKFAKAYQTWKDLKASAMSNQKLLRCGFSSLNYGDFLRMPVRLKDLLKWLSE